MREYKRQYVKTATGAKVVQAARKRYKVGYAGRATAERAKAKQRRLNMTQPELAIQHRKNVLRRYRMTLNDYQILHDRQNGCCAICTIPSPYRLHIDHDHITGAVRALLCRGCNNGLGFFKDSIENLKTAIAYIEHHAGKSSASACGTSVPNSFDPGNVVSNAVKSLPVPLGSKAPQ
jgi:hypothetical protein